MSNRLIICWDVTVNAGAKNSDFMGRLDVAILWIELAFF